LEIDDLTLVRRCKEGDRPAFKLLVQKYERKVYAIAFGMVKDREEARDIAQEAFLKVHRSLGTFKGDASFSTWLHRIVRNLAIDKIRAKRNESLSFDDAVGADEEVEPGFIATRLGTDPQRGALRRELAAKLNEALAQLPLKHREILLLREVEGMSYEDLAQTLDVPKGTVMSRLFHARSKMQKLLEGYLDEDPLAFASGGDEG